MSHLGAHRLCDRCGSLFTPTPEEGEEECPRCRHRRWGHLREAQRKGYHHRSPAESFRRARDGEHTAWQRWWRRDRPPPRVGPPPQTLPDPEPPPREPLAQRQARRREVLLDLLRRAPDSWWSREELCEEGFGSVGSRHTLGHTLDRLVREGLVEWHRTTKGRGDGYGTLVVEYRLLPTTSHEEVPDGE